MRRGEFTAIPAAALIGGVGDLHRQSFLVEVEIGEQVVKQILPELAKSATN